MECQQGIYGASQDNGYNARITRLEAIVAELQGQIAALKTRKPPDIGMRECAATAQAMKEVARQSVQQATQHLYAPLRSDVRALTDLAAFARSVAYTPPPPDLISSARALAALIENAKALLKDLT